MKSTMFHHNNTVQLNELWYESHKNLIASICIQLGQPDQIGALTEKFLGPKMKIKEVKDPNRPKRAKSAYLFFCDKKRPALMKKMREKQGKVQLAEIAKVLGAKWKKLTDEQKVPYSASAEQDKHRYEEAMVVYSSSTV